MEKIHYKIIIISIVISFYFLYLYNIYLKNNEPTNIHNLPIKTYSFNKCKFILNENFKKVLSDHNIKKINDINNSDLFIPCTYDDDEEELKFLQPKKNQIIFILSNIDEICGKNSLWINLKKFYGNKVTDYLPKSYILYHKNDLMSFSKEFDKNKIYIMKKNEQRQEGIKITNKLDEILNGYDNNYVIVQELLQDPYIIDGRKTNMRFYLLLVYLHGKMKAYVFNDGFMYYTKDKFIKNSLNMEPNITTGYIDRKVYKINPLTHQDLRIYLDKDRPLNQTEISLRKENIQLSKIYFERIYSLLKDITIGLEKNIGQNKKFFNNVSFQLFGVDIAMSHDYKPKIMEINKGPDMDSKDKRDGDLKYKCLQDMFQIVDLIPINTNNGFIQL